MDRWLCTWGGASFGFQDGDQLFRQDGSHAGKFDGAEVYDATTGRYLGEVIDDRLIRKLSKTQKVRTPPSARSRSPRVPRVARVARVMRVGYEDWSLR